MCINFPEGVSPLYAGLMPEVLASGKLVIGDDSSEGSQTAKSGTDEQKLYMRLIKTDKMPRHINVRMSVSFNKNDIR